MQPSVPVLRDSAVRSKVYHCVSVGCGVEARDAAYGKQDGKDGCDKPSESQSLPPFRIVSV